MVFLVVLTQEAFMTDHENKNTQHRSSAGETTPLHESRLATFLQNLARDLSNCSTLRGSPTGTALLSLLIGKKGNQQPLKK